MPQTENLRRAALDTGGAKGIGRAICRAVADYGMIFAGNYAGSAAAGRTESAEISGTIRIKRGLSLCDPEYPKSGKQAFFLYVFAGNRYHVFD